MKDAFFFRIGGFSLINDAVAARLRAEFPDLAWREIDVEREIVGKNFLLRARASVETLVRYGGRIVTNRQPPRDFFPRLPVVIASVRQWVRENVDPTRTALVFQTQSLFDARHPGVPHFVYTDHTYLANRRYSGAAPSLPVPAAWRKMEAALYRDATRTFVTSRFAGESVIDDYAVPSERVQCVHSGCNIAPPSSVDWDRRRKDVILFVGVNWERKGGPELVDAFHVVRANRPEAELWIVGCTPAVTEPGVRVLGRLSADETAKLYAEAGVFCLPSRMDPSASVLAEASGFGLPIVATAVGGNSERVIDGKTGFLCDDGNLSVRLGTLLDDPTMRRRFGEAGRALVMSRFTWEAVGGKMASAMRPMILQ